MRYAFILALPLAMIGAQPAAPQAPRVISVELRNFKFTPRTIVLDHGQAYLLRLTNSAKGGHDFSAPEFFAASRIAPADRKAVAGGEIEVHPGMVHEIRLTAPNAPGRYKLRCTHRFHKTLGMTGAIIVR